MSNLRSISTLTCAAAVVAAQMAVKSRLTVCVAVVATGAEAGGHPRAATRADGAFTASIDIARDKAWTAATFGLTTDRLCEALSSRDVLREGIALRPGVVLFGGGLPIVLDGATVGAIGVSGGSEDDDRACAAAGLAALAG